MARTRLLALCALLTLSGIGCAQVVVGPSFKSRLQKGQTYFGDMFGTVTMTTAAPVHLPAQNGPGSFLVSGLDGQLIRLDGAQGKLESKRAWVRLPKGIRGTPLLDVARGQLIVGCYDRKVHALSLPSGAPQWTTLVDGYVQAAPVLSEDTVLVGSTKGTLYGIAAFDGSLVWEVNLGHPIYAEAGVHPNWPRRALVGTDEGRVAVINTTDGAIVSEFAVEGGLHAGPAMAMVDDKPLGVIGTDLGHLVVVDLAGEPKTLWSSPVPAEAIWATPAIAPAPGGGTGAVIYAVSNASQVVTFDAITGEQGWSFAVTPVDQFHGTPLIAGDYLYVGSLNHRMYCVDRRDGKSVWEFTASGEFRARPLLHEGRIIAASNDHFLYGLDWKTGAPLIQGTSVTPDWPAVLDLTQAQEQVPVDPMATPDVSPTIQAIAAAMGAMGGNPSAADLSHYLIGADQLSRETAAAAIMQEYAPYKLGEFRVEAVVATGAGDVVATVVWQADKGGEVVQVILTPHLIRDASQTPDWRVDPYSMKPVSVVTQPVMSE